MRAASVLLNPGSLEENDGVQIARDSALLIADDVGNTIWRVSAAR